MQTSNRIAWITVIFYFNAFTHFFHSLLVFFSAPINSFHSAILSNFNSALFIWTNLIKYNMQDHNKNCVLYDMQYCLSAIWNDRTFVDEALNLLGAFTLSRRRYVSTSRHVADFSFSSTIILSHSPQKTNNAAQMFTRMYKTNECTVILTRHEHTCKS